MLEFALEHAVRHGMKRIIVAVPFLTIIEQTAAVYKAVFADFPEHYVLEHHSLAGLGKETVRGDAETDQYNRSERQRRLLSQNWDAPIVLTTNVQLLESLFSNRPSACRKLHNLMNAVILLDEAQSLPQHLAVSTLAALSHLSAAYHSTVMFATATQPAFDALDNAVRKHAVSGWQPREAAPDHPRFFNVLKRVNVIWPRNGEMHGWESLAGEVRKAEQVLVVVNLKRHARRLLEALGGRRDVFHLSTNLCPEHRRRVLDERADTAQGWSAMPARLDAMCGSRGGRRFSDGVPGARAARSHCAGGRPMQSRRAHVKAGQCHCVRAGRGSRLETALPDPRLFSSGRGHPNDACTTRWQRRHPRSVGLPRVLPEAL